MKKKLKTDVKLINQSMINIIVKYFIPVYDSQCVFYPNFICIDCRMVVGKYVRQKLFFQRTKGANYSSVH